MNIDPNEELAGFPIITVRTFLRKFHGCSWTAATMKDVLKATDTQILELLRVLLDEGYIEQVDAEGPSWSATVKGNALAQASAARPFKRSVAERELQRFLERVAEVRESDQWAWKVKRAILFGSLLTTDKEKVGDVDIAVALGPKESDPSRRERAERQRIGAAIRSGKQFRNITEEVAWPYFEVLKFLKSGSRVISLHDINAEAEILREATTKVIYEDEEARLDSR